MLIKEFDITNIIKFSTSTSSKGNQNKWHFNDYWIKEDYLGYEGLSEVVSSRIAKVMRFPYGVTEYFPCKLIHNDNIKTVGCYSMDFSKNMSVITLHRLFETFIPEIDLYDILQNRISPIERIEKVVTPLTTIIKTFDVKHYISTILEFDALIFNEDRHCNNIIFLYNGNEFYPALLFDCGAGLLSDITTDFILSKPLDVCIREVNNNAKLFSRSFKKQCNAFRKYSNIDTILNPNEKFELDISDLVKLYDERIISRVCALLQTKFMNISLVL